MLKKDLLKKIEQAKDDEDINELLKGTDIETAFKGEEPTLDVFKNKIKADKEFQKFMNSENDKHSSKEIKTMKENGSWETVFAEELKAKYPDLITDPKDKKLSEMQKQIDEMKAKEERQNLLDSANGYAKEKEMNLPAGIIKRCLGSDIDETKATLDSINEEWSKSLETLVDQKMKSHSYIPGASGSGEKTSIGATLAAKANANKSAPSNPWAAK
ncbi:DUF4355 domain-containing protein [uncultured Clostridium sp.]|uniref:DUF4355 domain-containing protein n=1 Tax=uncultured Clostridium sp. TaxID=59620 RepID=UPI0025E9DB3D|nr:DUF4355 domain-containing protein [uncultured Clostridium sp.]